MLQNIFIGTSGFSYADWKERFYPASLHQSERLSFYAKHFNAIELNVTFYRLPSEKAFQNWRDSTPQDFRFVLKAPRLITHYKKLKDIEAELEHFLERAAILEEKLTGILWQFPPAFRFDAARWENFYLLVVKKAPHLIHACEFRHRSWLDQENGPAIAAGPISLVWQDSPRFPQSRTIHPPVLYLRFHGPDSLYASDYDDDTLKRWADFVLSHQTSITTLFAFFNNDKNAYAVKNALRFREMLHAEVSR